MRALGVIGRVFIGAGVIILLFTVYQIWGTSLQESHTQAGLRNQLVHSAKDKDNQLKKALNQIADNDSLPTGPPVAAPPTAAPAEGEPVGDISIPKIGINQVVVQGTGTQDLRKGPGHYSGTPLPGQPGNSAIAGHRTTYGHPFYNLDGVDIGDPIVLTTFQGIFVYDATKTEIVAPDDTTPLQDNPGATITLTTCNPRFSASTRLIVVGTLTHSKLFSGVSAPKTTTTTAPTKQPTSNDLAGESSGSVLTTVLWGIIVAGVGFIVLYLAHTFRRRRWAIWIVGSLGVLVLLYFFFGAITPLLPSSF